MRILTVLDPIEQLELEGDTTYALMLAAAKRKHELWTCQIGHLGLEHNDLIAEACPTHVRFGDTVREAFEVESRNSIPVEAFDAVLMRKDPPVDEDYLHATWLLERARGKTLLVNDPRGLRDLNEHLSIFYFPSLIPPTIVTRNEKRLRNFVDEQGGAIIVTPIECYGGRGIFLVRREDPNMSSIFETATDHGASWTMAQRYLPEAAEGDKRILLVDGEPIGAVLRVPPKNEVRDNLHVGGTATQTELSEADKLICDKVGPWLKKRGQIFVGLDVIGGRLTEINITSPTGIRHLDELEGGDAAAKLIECIERKVAALK
jgi:glutathione synthase